MYVKFGFELHLYFEFLMEGWVRVVKDSFNFSEIIFSVI